MSIKSYRELIVWQKSIQVCTETYTLVSTFPKFEVYALADQMRRASVSIASNIAEGHNRNSTKHFLNFLSYSRSSVAELETQLIIANNLKYIDDEKLSLFLESCNEIGKMISGLEKSLKQKLQSPNP